MNPKHELDRLTELFPQDRPLFEATAHVAREDLPLVYQRMLAHHYHMTVTMEGYYGGPVQVRVLNERLDGDQYVREITLVRPAKSPGEPERVVQYGIVRFDFTYVTPQVKAEILAKDLPLGQVLINHNVLRVIDLGAIMRLTAGPGLAEKLAMPESAVTYGRLATIFCNGAPAVDLLEITAPLSELRPDGPTLPNIAAIQLCCRQPLESRRFYESLDLVFRDAVHGGWSAQMGATSLELRPRETVGNAGDVGDMQSFAVRVPDLDRTVRKLQSGGFATRRLGTQDSPRAGERIVAATDPDGRAVTLLAADATTEILSSIGQPTATLAARPM